MSTFDYESTSSALRSSIIVAGETTNPDLLEHLCMSMQGWLPLLESLEAEYNKVWREAYKCRQEHQEKNSHT